MGRKCCSRLANCLSPESGFTYGQCCRPFSVRSAVPVCKPRAFCVVSRLVLQRTSAMVAGIPVVRGSLRNTGTGQTTVTVESDKGFGVYSIGSCQTIRRRQQSLYGLRGQGVSGGLAMCYRRRRSKPVSGVVTVLWLAHYGVLA